MTTDTGTDTGAAAPAADAGTDTGAAADATENTGTPAAEDAGGDAEQNSDNTDTSDGDQGQSEGASEDTSDDQSQKTDEADDKGDEGNDEDAKPVEYGEFTLPEGMSVNTESLDKLMPILAEHGVPQDKAQEVVDLGAELLSKTAKDAADAHKERIEGWRKETTEKYSKDGDAAFAEKTATAQVAINKMFSDDERQIISSWGLGNMPGFFTAMHALGSAMKEDSSFNSGGSSAQGDETLADVWYPDS